jgi:N-acetylglucosaminyl-diphospho-decaprenol L-rhamnosyltransferase
VPGSIDVVIPAYNRWDLTESCLADLAAQTVTHRTIVVDNGSTDQTRAALRSDWPQVTVVELDHNHPFTQAVNRGVSAGEGEHVILLNNDVRLRHDFLERLVAPMRDDRRVGSVASLMLTPDEATIDSFGVSADVTLAGFARLHGREPSAALGSAPALAGAEGTAGAYRRAAWEQAGGLDESISAYMEILDLALRLRRAGWSAAAAPDAVGVHLGSSTFGRGSARQRELAAFSRGYLLRRYGVLRGSHAARALFTEAAVASVDALANSDLRALRGRFEGWRAARGRPRHPKPPLEAIDTAISLRRSFELRRAAYRA